MYKEEIWDPELSFHEISQVLPLTPLGNLSLCYHSLEGVHREENGAQRQFTQAIHHNPGISVDPNAAEGSADTFHASNL